MAPCAVTSALSTSTLSSNTAADGSPSLGRGGGGIYNEFGGTVTLAYATVVANSNGLFDDMSAGPATTALTGTIIASSTPHPNCTGPMTEGQGANLDTGTECGFSRTTDLTATNPLLGPLANNGGPTQTMALLPGSPAIERGGTHATGCPCMDQRGLPRPDEPSDKGVCDMGAYESQASAKATC